MSVLNMALVQICVKYYLCVITLCCHYIYHWYIVNKNSVSVICFATIITLAAGHTSRQKKRMNKKNVYRCRFQDACKLLALTSVVAENMSIPLTKLLDKAVRLETDCSTEPSLHWPLTDDNQSLCKYRWLSRQRSYWLIQKQGDVCRIKNHKHLSFSRIKSHFAFQFSKNSQM